MSIAPIPVRLVLSTHTGVQSRLLFSRSTLADSSVQLNEEYISPLLIIKIAWNQILWNQVQSNSHAGGDMLLLYIWKLNDDYFITRLPPSNQLPCSYSECLTNEHEVVDSHEDPRIGVAEGPHIFSIDYQHHAGYHGLIRERTRKTTGVASNKQQRGEANERCRGESNADNDNVHSSPLSICLHHFHHEYSSTVRALPCNDSHSLP